jgi:hypothetical protein
VRAAIVHGDNVTSKKAAPTRGRPKSAPGRVRGERAVCYLLPGEVPAVEAEEERRGLSRSDLLRAGLVALGVRLESLPARKPGR